MREWQNGVCASTRVLRYWTPTARGEKPLDDANLEWQRKGATLSDTTAQKEFGLTQRETFRAVDAGKLQYREGSIYGNPFLRLLRREVEALVREKHGKGYLVDQRRRTELARINRELKRLGKEIATLEEQRSKLLGGAAK